MPTIVGVRFKPVTKTYYFLPPKDTRFALNDPVIVETSRGQELGWVSIESKEISQKEAKGNLKPILRKASPLDLMSLEKYHQQEAEALQRCKDKANELNLPMKIVQAEYSYNGKKLLFLFTAEQRIDFRELVRYLVRAFRTRVEMRQIGARDEAKIIDGYGRCGRQMCCSSWLTEFHPVSIKMAKTQQLPLAPAEISGACGRLLCCLSYENETYTELKKTLPRNGTHVKEETHGYGVIRGLNILKETAIVKFEDDTRGEFPVTELTIIENRRPQRAQEKKQHETQKGNQENKKRHGRKNGSRRPKRK